MSKSERNGLVPIIAQAIEEMEVELGCSISLSKINLGELGRRTGLSRSKLRTLKKKGFRQQVRSYVSDNKEHSIKGFSSVLDGLLQQGIKNSAVCLQRLQLVGYQGSLTSVKRYISMHKDLLPPKRLLIETQGNRGRRFTTDPGEAFQMDWGFTKVIDPSGGEYKAACFAMICHHCGQFYIEFFPNAKQENLFIGMIHSFLYMGIPKYVLTDNMKSVVIKRDIEGHPIWQHDYEAFMKSIGFNTKLCKPRHPFTKGKVERLVRYVKDNFLSGRVFSELTSLNREALEWCNTQNNRYHKTIDAVPNTIHLEKCAPHLNNLPVSETVMKYLCPARKISFDGFVYYEGIRFGVPYSYTGQFVRVMRNKDIIYIYSNDMKQELVTYPVAWDKCDRYCDNQYEAIEQPEEFPTATVKTTIKQIAQKQEDISFDKFDFDKEEE